MKVNRYRVVLSILPQMREALMRNYTQLTEVQRYLIYALKREGMPYRDIASRLAIYTKDTAGVESGADQRSDGFSRDLYRQP